MAMRSSHRPETPTCWTDESGVIHICESAAPIGSELLIWTLCDLEVGSDLLAPSTRTGILCSKCVAADGVLKRRAQRAHHSSAPS